MAHFGSVPQLFFWQGERDWSLVLTVSSYTFYVVVLGKLLVLIEIIHRHVNQIICVSANSAIVFLCN